MFWVVKGKSVKDNWRTFTFRLKARRREEIKKESRSPATWERTWAFLAILWLTWHCKVNFEYWHVRGNKNTEAGADVRETMGGEKGSGPSTRPRGFPTQPMFEGDDGGWTKAADTAGASKVILEEEQVSCRKMCDSSLKVVIILVFFVFFSFPPGWRHSLRDRSTAALTTVPYPL